MISVAGNPDLKIICKRIKAKKYIQNNLPETERDTDNDLQVSFDIANLPLEIEWQSEQILHRVVEQEQRNNNIQQSQEDEV